MKKISFILLLLTISFTGRADFSGGASFVDNLLIKARFHEVGSSPSRRISDLLRVGETDLSRAVIAGDIKAFRKALRKSLLGSADVFLENWLVMTNEGDTLFHLLGKVPKEERAAFAYEFHRITEVLNFPTKNKFSKGSYRLPGVYIKISWPERAPLVQIIREGESVEVFHEEIRRLLTGPVEELLGLLHVVTDSKETLDGLIRAGAEESKKQKEYEQYAVTIDFLRGLFRVPLYHRNQKNLLPVDVAKRAGNVEAYSVLREAAKDVNKGLIGSVALGAGWVSALKAGALLTLENGEVLNNMADKFGMESMPFLGMALSGQVLVPLAGMGCYLFFQSLEGKKTIQNLEPPAEY